MKKSYLFAILVCAAITVGVLNRAAALDIGFGNKDNKSTAPAAAKPESTPVASNGPLKPRIVASDTNKDGKPDRWEKYENGVLKTVEADTNFDGTPDQKARIEGTNNGEFTKTSDTNKDGQADRWEKYKAGILDTVEVDTNFDGKPDEKGILKEGRVTNAEKDADYDGKTDTWVTY